MSKAGLVHTEALIYQAATKIDFIENNTINQWKCYSRQTQHSFIRRVVLTAGACTSTAISIIVPRLFSTPIAQQRCLGSFPACDPKTLITPSFLPSFLHPAFTCETLLLIICVAICLHWTCMSLLFQSARWREKYFPMALYTAGGATFLAAQVVKDSATVLIQVLPLASDICIIVCLSLDFILP
ncbi:hypothetical protein FLAG1_01055 [Fusarium langsethiae]|uniref:Uncharacterized protein n=1 Tax=Fusarium langsethiae TaxID=179993 RepID=A0A0N0DHS6_FUSLA|nr:hypothetical protein FLAG1_01055 [Fusarium langsethiae]